MPDVSRSRLLARRETRFVLLVGLALTVSDWPSELLSGFWVDHAFVSSVVSSLLFLAVALFVVETWVAEQQRRELTRVAGIAFNALAGAGAHVRDGLRLLVTGTDPAPDGVARPSPRSAPVRSALERTGAGAVGPREERVRALTADAAWRQLAVEEVVDLRVDGREVVARWAPVMLGNPALSRWLSDVAALHERLRLLQQPLQALRDGRADEFEKHGGVAAVERRWMDVLVDCFVLEERLQRASGRKGWRSRARDQLSADEIELVEEGHRQRETTARRRLLRRPRG